MVLCRYCTGTFVALDECFTGSLLAFYWYCVATALVLHAHRTVTSLVLHWYHRAYCWHCTGSPLHVLCNIAGTILVLLWHCDIATPLVREVPHLYCAGSVLVLNWHYTASYWHCTVAKLVRMLHDYSASALRIQCHYSTSAVPTQQHRSNLAQFRSRRSRFWSKSATQGRFQARCGRNLPMPVQTRWTSA